MQTWTKMSGWRRLLVVSTMITGLTWGCGVADDSPPDRVDRADRAPGPDDEGAAGDRGDGDDETSNRACEYVTDRVVGTVPDGTDTAGPDLALDADGAARVTWAVEDSSGPIHIARPGPDGWSTTTSERFQYEPTLRDLQHVDLAVGGDTKIVAAYSANYRGDTHRALTLFDVSGSSWETLDRFGNGYTLQSALQIDDRGRLHLLMTDTAPDDEAQTVLRYLWGRPDNLSQRTLYRTGGRTERSRLVRGQEGRFRALFVHPDDDHRLYTYRPGAAAPEPVEGIDRLETLRNREQYAADADGSLHVLGRTGERARAIARQRDDGGWQTTTVAETLDASWDSSCRAGRHGYDELHGETCRVDHTSWAPSHRTLLRRHGEVWAMQVRETAEGTATWQCEKDYIGCLAPCNLDASDVTTNRSVELGPIDDGGGSLEATDLDLPTEMFSTARFGPEGDLHFTYAERSDDGNPRRIRYGRVRCR